MPTKERFDRTIQGKKVSLFKLKNGLDSGLFITNYGCRVVSLLVHDRNNNPLDVVVGFDSLDGYLTATEVYHGATIGRFANRIAGGRFRLNNIEYVLPVNNEPNHLHGGPEGFHTRVWDVDEVHEDSITLSYLSVDGEAGYPGNLKTTVSFRLSEMNEVVIRYRATTDQPTVLNLTNHAYFNLNGQGSGSILQHQLQIRATKYTPVNESLIPLGNQESVKGTPFDFTRPETIGKRIHDDHPQLQYGNGYDHNYVIDRKNNGLSPAATVRGDQSGILMEMHTDQPGVQFYTGNFMSGENIIKGRVPDHFRTAFCLETQHFPDTPNQPGFPSAVLEPTNVFESTTIYTFSAE